MSYALVGSIGSVAAGSFQQAVTPAWGTGESRTAGNLLICWVAGLESGTLPATPSGWSLAAQENATFTSSSVFYKIATGADAAPTIAGIANAQTFAQLAEFSGVYQFGSLLDRTAIATGTANPVVATAAGVDALAGELIVYATSAFYSTGSGTITPTVNNGTAINSVAGGPSSYAFGYALSTGNSVADSVTATATGTFAHMTNAMASFKVNDLYTQPTRQPWGPTIDASITIINPSTYAWSLTSKPTGSAATITNTGANAHVHVDLEGTYTISVTATDGSAHQFIDGGSTLVVAPMYIFGASSWGPALAKIWTGSAWV